MERNERNTVGLRHFFDTLASILIGIQNLQVAGTGYPETEEVLGQLEEASVTLRLLTSENIIDEDYSRPLVDLQELIASIHTHLGSFLEHISPTTLNTPFSCTTEIPTTVGRPKIIIHEEQIQFLRGLHFSWEKIAWLLGISETTLRRRRQGMHMTGNEQHSWTNITGLYIHVIVCKVKVERL